VESCVTLARLAAEAPDDVRYGFFLGFALSVASGMHLNLGDTERALVESEEAVSRLRDARARLAGSNEVIGQLASGLFQLADVHRAAGDFDAALGVCEEAFEIRGLRADILFQGAEITGHLAADARGIKGPGGAGAAASGTAGEDHAEIAVRAEELCLTMLDEAVARGFSDRPRLRADVFASLQGVEAFEAIVERTGAVP